MSMAARANGRRGGSSQTDLPGRFRLDAGGGAVKIKYPVGTLSENKFYLGLRAEYVYSQKLLLGIEASGWLIQPGEME